MTREEKDDKNQARLDKINNKNDVALFRKQIIGLKEYAAERKKIQDVQKSDKMAVKLSAVVDTDDIAADSKTLMGYIRQDAGDNTMNMYELTFDRKQRKISSIKRTPEAMDADKEAADEKEEKAATKKETKAATQKADVKKATPKKKKDDDDDDDDPDDKPVKGKKDSDDD